jgi:RNA polymerase sigma-70 factor (ECF subfamily)
MDEQKLVKLCQAGQTDQFARLYDLYIKKIYGYVYFRIQHREISEDLVSQIFIKALEKINSFDETKAKFTTWLYQIARNTVIDYFRTRKVEANIDDIWSLSSSQDIERDAGVRENLEQAEQLLKALSSEQREIVLLRIWDGLPYKEIAEMVGKTEASCKMIFSRVMTKLRLEIMPLIVFTFLNLVEWFYG